MASEHLAASSSQDATPIPAVALAQSQSEVLLPPSNCSSCKVLSRHLRISREWNNFFRLKLDQRNMLLHVAADYKRQKQRCLQLQMSLDQQNRENGEMRDQLTTLLLEMNPLKERVQSAEEAAKEERLRREKAESNEYNLQFLLTQQAHKLEDCKKLKPSLLETLEKKLSALRSEIRTLKEDISHKSRVEWELQQKLSLAHSKRLCVLKKARWGLSLAHKYGSRLSSQGQLQEESSHEWVRLKSLLKEVESALHKHYLALCQRVAVRPRKETWLNDFSAVWEEDKGGGDDGGAKQSGKIIHDDSLGVTSEEEEEICDKNIQVNCGNGSEQDCNRADGISKEPTQLVENDTLCSNTQGKKDLSEVLTTYNFKTSVESCGSDSVASTHHTAGEGAAPHTGELCDTKDGMVRTKSTSFVATSAEGNEGESIASTCSSSSKEGKVLAKLVSSLDTSAEGDESDPITSACGSKDGKVLTKSTSILDTSAEANESDPVPSTGGSKDRKVVAKLSSILDTSAEDSESDPVPSTNGSKDDKVLATMTSAKDSANDSISVSHDGVDAVTSDASNAGKDTSDHLKSTFPGDITTKDTEKDPLNSAGEAGPHKPDRVMVMVSQESTKQRSILDTSTEGSDEEVVPGSEVGEPDPAFQSSEREIKKNTVDSSGSVVSPDGCVNYSEKLCKAGPGVADPPAASYHLDEELQAILERMRPHEKLEDMDSFSSHSSEGLGRGVKTDVHDPYTKQSLLSSFSDSEEEEQKMKAYNAEDENGDEVSAPPRILTSQMSEGFSVVNSHRDNILQDDLDLSTDTLDPDDEKEEEKATWRRVSMINFPSTQSFSCDMEGCVAAPGSTHSPGHAAEAADEWPEVQQVCCHSELQQAGDKGDDNAEPVLDSQKTQSRDSLRRLRVMLAVDESGGPDAPAPVDAESKAGHDEEDEGSGKGGQRKVVKEVQEKTTEPQKKQKTRVVKGKSKKPVEKYSLETSEKASGNVEGTTGPEERAETDGGRIPEACAQRASVTEEQRHSPDKEEEDGKESVTEPKEEIFSGRKKRKSIRAEEERRTDAVENKITESDEAITEKEAAGDAGSISFDGQKEISYKTEKQERIVAAAADKTIKIMEERTSENVEKIPLCGEERTLDAQKGRSAAAVVKPLCAGKEGNHESVSKRAAHTHQESMTDAVVGKKEHETMRKRTTENLEKMITETVTHTTVCGAETIAGKVQETDVLKEKNTDSVDERTTEEQVAGVKENARDENSTNEVTPFCTLKENNNCKESNTEASQDKAAHLTENVHVDKDGFIKVVKDKTSDTLEGKATDGLEKIHTKSFEQRTVDAVRVRTTDALEDRSTAETLGERAKKIAEERARKAVENRHLAIVQERTNEAVTRRNSDADEGIDSKASRKNPHETLQNRTTQTCKRKSMTDTEETLTDMEERNAESKGEDSEVEEVKTSSEEESNVSCEKANGHDEPTKRVRRRRKATDTIEPKDEKDEGGKGEHEATFWKRRLKRQGKFECESEEGKPEGKGKKLGGEGKPKGRGKTLRGCVLKGMVRIVEFERERKREKEEKKISKIDKVKNMEARKKMKLEEKIISKKKENGKKQKEKVMEEESEEEEEEEEEEEGKINLQKGRKEEKGKIKASEIEAHKKNQEKDGRIETEGMKGAEEAESMGEAEEEVDDGREEGGKHDERMKQNEEEEDVLSDAEEGRRKEKTRRRMKGEEQIQQEEKEQREEEGRRVEIKRKSTQREKWKQKKRTEEERKLWPLKAEGQSKSAWNLEDRKQCLEAEGKHESSVRGKQECDLFAGRNFLDTTKGQEKIVFSWSLSSSKRMKRTTFIKCGSLTKVIPDSLGSVRHSVYAMECRTQPSEEQQKIGTFKMSEQPRAASPVTHEGHVMVCEDSIREKKKRLQKTNTSVVEKVSRGMMNESREDHINRKNKEKHAKDDAVRNEKASRTERRRGRSSSASSDEGLTLCSREPQSKNRPRLLIVRQSNAAASSSGSKVSLSRGARQPKPKVSVLSLFGVDSSNSNSSETEEDTVVEKKSRRFEGKMQQQQQQQRQQSLAHNRLPSPFAPTVNEKKKTVEKLQVSRSRKLPTSSLCSLTTSRVMNEFGKKNITKKMHHKQSWWSEESQSDASSDIPKRPFIRKCKSLLIASDSEDEGDQSDNSNSGIFQRKRRRKRKVKVSDRSVNEESDSSSTSDHSSAGKKRHVAKLIITGPLTTRAKARTQTETQRKGNTESCQDTLSPSSSTLFNIPHALKNNPGQQKRDSLLLETPPQSYKRQKRSSSLSVQTSLERKVDASSASDHTAEPDEDSQEEDNLVSKTKSDSSILVDKDDAQPQHKGVTQVLSHCNGQDQNRSLAQSESDTEHELVVEESLDDCTYTDSPNPTNQSTQLTSAKTRECLGQRLPHLGPAVLCDRPTVRSKPAPDSKVQVSTGISVPAGPDYIERLFSKVNKTTGVCSAVKQSGDKSSFGPAQDTHPQQSQGKDSSNNEGTHSQSHSLVRVDYQGQCPIPLPNFYGTLGPTPPIVSSAPPRTAPNFSSSHSELSPCQSLQPTASHSSSTGEQVKASLTSSTPGASCLTPDPPRPTPSSSGPTHDQRQLAPLKLSSLAPRQPQSVPGHPHHSHAKVIPASSHPHATPGLAHPLPDQIHAAQGHSNPGQPSECSVPGPHQQQAPWLPEVITEKVIHHGRRNQKGHSSGHIEEIKETLEEVVASRMQSRWWVSGLDKLCASITTATLPFFLRSVLESIMRSDPLEPLQHYNSLPPRLFRLLQVVCVVERRLTPQHPQGLRRALLRAIQAMVTQPSTEIRPQSLACLTAWYVALASIDGQHEEGQEWGRGRAFLVDLLFHHPGTAHLSILTAARTCRGLFLKHVHYRELSGLEQVMIWLAHYGPWVGRPGVRSDLTKWLVLQLDSKKPTQNPAALIKNLVDMLEPRSNKDKLWGAVVGLVVLTRWQGRSWAQKHLLPVLSAAAAKITATVPQEDQGSGDVVPREDLESKISLLFGKLGQALPLGPPERQTDDIVKKMEDAVNTLLGIHQ